MLFLLLLIKNLRMTRSTATKKISKEDFIKRDKNQMNVESKKKKADFIFTNDGTSIRIKAKSHFTYQPVKANSKVKNLIHSMSFTLFTVVKML